MEVAFRLRKRETPARTDAVFVPSTDAADVLRACAGCPDGWPGVFRVAGGFVVVPRGPVPAVSGTVRLRRPAGDLFLPVDADLVPALRTDEIVALTEARGLLFLPGGPVLAFDPAAPLAETHFVSLKRLPGTWEPLPPRPERADHLHTIRVDTPPDAVAAVFESGKPTKANPLGGPGDAAGPVPDDARPPATSPGKTLAANATFAAGQFLNFLGRAFGLPGWAKAGADLARRAVESVPRLSESVFGAQEAALRELLRQFQAGNIEEALRRAPIAVADPNAGPVRIDAGSHLGSHDTRYSLASLLGGGSGGGAAWMGGGDVWVQLAAQYRKLADEATRRGDFRRAAYIYGVLLRDPRSAAKALDAGGLHRDAAVIYRDKLNDPLAAAGCFERAGAFDEAVRLYEAHGEFVKAADLLRTLGEESAAITMYVRASDKLAADGRHRDAGDLVRDKAGDLTRADGYYALGWANGGPGAVGCGERLVDLRVAAGAWEDLRTLADHAAAKFAPPHADEAGRFFGHLASRPLPDEVKDDVRDVARLALACHLRHAANDAHSQSAAVSVAFGKHSQAWPGPVVRDAKEALRLARLAPATVEEPPAYPTVRLLPSGPVTAAVIARGSFDVIVAGANGSVAVWKASNNDVVLLNHDMCGPCIGLAVCPSGRFVVSAEYPNEHEVAIFAWDNGNFVGSALHVIAPPSTPYVEPALDVPSRAYLWLHGPDASRIIDIPSLSLNQTIPYEKYVDGWYRLCIAANELAWRWGGDALDLLGNDGTVFHDRPNPDILVRGTVRIPWVPVSGSRDWAASAPVDYLTPTPDTLELAGLSESGAAYWTGARWDGAVLTATTATLDCTAGYRAVGFVAPCQLAAVTGDGQVHFLRSDGSPVLRKWGPTRTLGVPAKAVFVAPRPSAHELLVVLDDGTGVRVPLP